MEGNNLMPLLLLALIFFVGFFLMIGLLLIPFHFTVYSLYYFLTVPVQLIKIALNPRLRANHSLEHATVNVIEKKYGRQRISGMARENGFILQGHISPAIVEICALEGLSRMKKGETDLRIHPKCGTSMLASNLVASVIFLVLLWYFQVFTLFNIIIAIGAAYLLGPLLGRIFQVLFTTSSQVHHLEIANVEFDRPPGIMGFLAGPGRFFIRTVSTPIFKLPAAGQGWEKYG